MLRIFHAFLETIATDWTDNAYVATEDNGQVVGFFCYSVNIDDNIGFLKFIIVDKSKRGMGYGKEMLNLAYTTNTNAATANTTKIPCQYLFSVSSSPLGNNHCGCGNNSI
ncbi:MAG: GNAT family N-acetyltransferase [Lachnospiraceae bacterium]|nr:GNAT family N-acetyltransferase [Lachnospiraceae bacterium]